ncbi:alpha/beta hydrolase family protein [Urechidicola croceus]|uniref:Proline iminopeptidase n=1 Tax=Urechidicola croceus TaxID=1850246 RepID=A0A1D8P937_9FLAO|nr:alpha/beta hydrolase [Urechidicola croceus]AOW21091.1 hypothetical protein LPB138_10555 [Urechidicola croceus]
MKLNYLLLIGSLFLFSTNAQNLGITENKFITINNIEQWITIDGKDKNKPIILFLHGGPGSTMSLFDDTVYGSWKKDFVLVNWDQRGAGRTYGKTAPIELDEEYILNNPLTLEQMVDDGIKVSEYLINHLKQQKIVLIGTSWGSILGTKMILKRPDLFHAYVGHSQVVSFSGNYKKAYDKIYKMSEEAKDSSSISKLNSIGKPPYDNTRTIGQFFRILKKYERLHSTPAPETWWNIRPEYDNETDRKNRYDGDDYSFIHFVGHKKMGIKSMEKDIDFLSDGFKLDLPVYYIQGEEDIMTPKEASKEYFDKIEAPKKEYFLVPNAAHGHNKAIVDMQFKVVSEYIVPEINKK